MTVTNVYKVAKAVTGFLALCTVYAGLIMAGPILNALGVIGG
jgi:hypothetical protein